MAKKAKYEIYEGFTKRKKKYIVCRDINLTEDFINYCKKFFRCSVPHLNFRRGYIYLSELYYERPSSCNYKVVTICTYVR